MNAGRGCLVGLIGGVAALVLGIQILVALLSDSAGAACTPGSGGDAQPGASKAANAIPSNYLKLYQATGPKYGISWTVLAGVGKVETNHGTSTLPGVHSGQNYAGAGGPMQFLQPTWDAFGVDGDGDGKKDRYNPADAIPGAANYLRHNGADEGGEKLRKAIWHYNHSWDYVDNVLGWADKYADGAFAVGDANSAGAACEGGFSASGNWPPGAACPAGTALGPESITQRMRCVRDQIKTLFKFTGTIGCYRSNGGIAGGGEHPLGRACDFMVHPGSTTQVQLGYSVANWARDNAKRLGVYYIIYRQRIWNIQRADEGWRAMEDRGSITQNHFDHVHISVLP